MLVYWGKKMSEIKFKALLTSKTLELIDIEQKYRNTKTIDETINGALSELMNNRT